MRPIEEFVYVGNQVIVPDQASLMRCYYPIIGGEGYALYQYFEIGRASCRERVYVLV